MKELKIDNELRDLLPPLTDDEYRQLEKNILQNGFDKNYPIMTWQGFIADGHNRYNICKKHNIDFVYGVLGYETKEEVMEWMIDIQLGRRNLSSIQRIAVAEKYRPIYEKQAKENQGTRTDLKSNNFLTNSSKSSIDKSKSINVRETLAKKAMVSEDTYAKGKKILDSGDKELINEVFSGNKSINAGYKVLASNKATDEKDSNKPDVNNSDTQKRLYVKSRKIPISDETKEICADLKTEKTKEYLDSTWEYRSNFIECMNGDAGIFYDTFKSHLDSLNKRVTKDELDICIDSAKKVIDKLLNILTYAQKNTKLKTED